MIERVVRHQADCQIHAFLDLDILEKPHIDVEIASSTKLITGLIGERRDKVVKGVVERPGIQAGCVDGGFSTSARLYGGTGINRAEDVPSRFRRRHIIAVIIE